MKRIVIGDCRTLNFKTRVEGSSLFGHVVRSYLINSQDDCELKCYIEDKCMSINFGPGDNGAHLCELSDSDHDLHPEDLKKRDGFIYRSTEVRVNRGWHILEKSLLVVCLSFLPSLCPLHVRPSARLSVCLSVCSSVCLYVRLSIRLSLWLL